MFRFRLYLLLGVFLLSNFAVLAQPAAGFNIMIPASNCNPAVYSFVNASTGTGLTFEWNFGVYPGVNSVFPDPSTTYLNCGTFQVKLIVTNTTTGLKDSTAQIVNVRCSPTANFTTESAIGCLPYSTTFSSTSAAGSGSITEYIWDFGDGSSGTGINPINTYQESGCKNITLIVTNSYNCVSDTTINNLLCIYPPPVAGFTSGSQTYCAAPFNVTYQANAGNSTAPYSYHWTFQGGAPVASSSANPVVDYITPGSFTATLITTDTHGCSDTLVSNNYIVVDSNAVDFTIGTSSRCVPANITMNGFSTGSPVAWNWTASQPASVSNVSASNTSVAFPDAGNYNVCLTVTYLGGCTAQKCSTIVINGSPIANFGTIGLLNTCVSPNAVTFLDSSSGSNLSYNWSFPGGTPATANSAIPPAVSYSTCGDYSASLTVTDDAGCSSSASKTNFLRIYCPLASYTVTPSNGCLPLIAYFNSTASTGNPISWLWDFNDSLSGAANTSMLQNPTHTFYNAGCYTVKLTTTNAEGCIAHYELQAGVCAGWQPHANFSANPPQGCANQPINFIDSSTGTFAYTEYLWGFHDSAHLINASFQQNPNYTFWDAGTYDIVLIVSNYGCADTLTKDDFIHTIGPLSSPHVIPNCSDPLTVILDGSASPGAASYEWIILGGTPASATTPTVTVTFPGPGDYNASLYVEDASNCSDLQNTVVHISGVGADFNAYPLTGCQPLQSCFSNVSSNAVSYEWRITDASGIYDTSTVSSPCFNFSNAGIYSVQLIVTDALGCIDTLYKPDYIRVSDPVASFAGTPLSGCAPLEVNFLDSSTALGAGIAEWNWNFGDVASGSANSSDLQNPVHTYIRGGRYPVMLSIIDSNGCTRDTIKYVQVNQPDANFASTGISSCEGLETCFTVASLSEDVSYHWNFGDGTTADSTNTCHLYTAAGVFNITLVATDTMGCSDTVTRMDSIHVLMPHAQFVADNTSTTCPPLAVSFSNLSTNVDSLTAWNWDFGDGQVSTLQTPFHIYNSAGKFTVTLIATDVSGCSDTLVYPDYINISGPTAFISTAPTSGCVPHQTCMSAISVSATTYTWNLGDGMVIDGSDSICYTYTRTGSFYPELILGDGTRCIFSLPMGRVDVLGTVAKFVADSTMLCQQATVNFTDSSFGTSAAASWSWNFGDPASGAQNISTQQNPVHFFASPGIYRVIETIVSANGCTDSTAGIITVHPSPSPSITVSDSTPCEPDSVLFAGQSNPSDSITSRLWNFDDVISGNSNTSNLQNPFHYYSAAGTYHVTYTEIDVNGCPGSANAVVTVNPKPNIQDIDIDPAEGCQPLAVSLNANSTDAYHYTWDFGMNTSPLSSYSPTATITYPDTGTYVISLYVSSINGCKDTLGLSDTVKVHGVPVAAFDALVDSLAYPYDGTVAFINHSENADNYLWDFGDETTSSETNPSHHYDQIDWFSALLIATTNYGCADTASKLLHVIKKALYVPNALHPDHGSEDELVKVWKPTGIGLLSYWAQVFDQWGKLLWESESLADTSPEDAWNGTYMGKPCPQDVYVWKIDAVFLDGTKWIGMSYSSDVGGGKKTIGSITLVR